MRRTYKGQYELRRVLGCRERGWGSHEELGEGAGEVGDAELGAVHGAEDGVRLEELHLRLARLRAVARTRLKSRCKQAAADKIQKPFQDYKQE